MNYVSKIIIYTVLSVLHLRIKLIFLNTNNFRQLFLRHS